MQASADTHLGVPVRNMLVALPLTLLSQSSNNIAQRAQALVNALRLLQPVSVARSATLLKPLATSKVDKVQTTLACLARQRVLTANAEREHRVRAGGSLVHECCRNGATALGEREESTNLRRGRQRDDIHVGDGRAAGLRVVFDLVLLLVEFALA